MKEGKTEDEAILSNLSTRKGILTVKIMSMKNQFGVQKINSYIVFWERDHCGLS